MYKHDKVLEKLYKKAIGYDIEEIVEEYSGGEHGGELIKKKITKKPIPPDVNALKTYIELTENKGEFENMSDDELIAEKERIIVEMYKKKAKSIAKVKASGIQITKSSEV